MSAKSKSRSAEALNISADVLAELDQIVQQEDVEGLTMDELCEKSGRGKLWWSKRLRVLRDHGRLKVGQKMTTRLDGRTQPKPSYRWV